ncbi:cutinase family protein [Gordonia sp. DT219]|uniref:cutinase family protein n=1 Tax=Gordonia sp. DT219 TaxID=3416658 RepID=UPI003CF8449F
MLALLWAPGAAATAGAVDCKTGAVFMVNGTNDVGGAAYKNLQTRFPADQWEVHDLGASDEDYTTALWPVGAIGYNDDVARGKQQLIQQVATYQTACPNSEIVIVGYSQGARVAGDVLSDIAHGRATTTVDGVTYTISDSNEIRGELYSDPRRDGDKSGRGIELSWVGLIPGLTLSGPRDGFGDIPVISYCTQGDGICDMPDPLYDPIGALNGIAGYVLGRHGSYQNAEMLLTPNYALGEFQNILRPMPSMVKQYLGVDIPSIYFDLPFQLAAIQPVLTAVYDLMPPLPKLGYGAYLPDPLTALNMLSFDTATRTAAVKAIAASLTSLVLLPANFTIYWGQQGLTLVHGIVTSPMFTAAGAAIHNAALELIAKIEAAAKKPTAAPTASTSGPSGTASPLGSRSRTSTSPAPSTRATGTTSATSSTESSPAASSAAGSSPVTSNPESATAATPSATATSSRPSPTETTPSDTVTTPETAPTGTVTTTPETTAPAAPAAETPTATEPTPTNR